MGQGFADENFNVFIDYKSAIADNYRGAELLDYINAALLLYNNDEDEDEDEDIPKDLKKLPKDLNRATIYNYLGIDARYLDDKTVIKLTDEQIKAEKKRRNETSLGNSYKIIRVKVAKSRFGTEGRNAWVLLDATYGLVRNSGLFKLLLDFGAIKKVGNSNKFECPGVIEGSFFKKDFAKIFAQNENEYIDKLQPIMDEIEAEMKRKRLSVNVSDLQEFEEQEEESAEDALEGMIKVGDDLIPAAEIPTEDDLM